MTEQQREILEFLDGRKLEGLAYDVLDPLLRSDVGEIEQATYDFIVPYILADFEWQVWGRLDEMADSVREAYDVAHGTPNLAELQQLAEIGQEIEALRLKCRGLIQAMQRREDKAEQGDAGGYEAN